MADIVDGAVGAGSFKTLVAAFAKLPAGTMQELLTDIPTLTSILTYP